MTYEEENENSQLAKVGIIIFICVIIYWIMDYNCDFKVNDFLDEKGNYKEGYFNTRGVSCEYFIHKGLLWSLIILLLFFASIYVIWLSRYYSNHVTCNGFSGSIDGRPVIVGDWCIFACGTAKYPVYIEGKLATLIIPKIHVNRAGRNYVSKTLVSRFPFENLPHDIGSYIYHNRDHYNLKNIYFGKFSEEFVHNNPEILDYEDKIEKLQRAVNERNLIIERDHDIVVEKVKVAKEIVKDESLGSKFKQMFKRNEEE